MEEFFQYGSRSPIFWIEEEAFPENQTAFSRFANQGEAFPANQRAFVMNTEQEKAFPANQSAFFMHTEQEKTFPANQSGFVRYAEQQKDLPANHSAFVKYAEQEEVLLAKRSAFVRYRERPMEGVFGSKSCAVKSNNPSVNKRMIEFLRRNWTPPMESKDSDRERCYRHMISERMRREKQKQSYSALRSLLPRATKSDKNSIIQVAAKAVQELEKYKAELERQNAEIEAILAERESGRKEAAKIRLRVATPSSGIDSMLEVLKCLRNMGSNTRAIQLEFSTEELLAALEIESEIEAAEVEKAVQKTLVEVEMKLRNHFPI